MAIMTLAILVLGLFFAIGLVVYLITIYNGLIALKNNIGKSWANIDVLLKQRFEELPKLVETVKGYVKHEQGTLEKLTEARTCFLNASTVQAKAEADGMLNGALKSLFAVSENYPDLKASTNFKQLQDRISGLENEIADRREFYNDSVNHHNIRIASLPDVFIARLMGLAPQELFRVAAEERQDVKISF